MSAKSKNQNKIFVITAHSESGDDYGPYLVAKKPTEKQVWELFNEIVPDELDDIAKSDVDKFCKGSSFLSLEIGYLMIKVHEETIMELK